MSVARRVFGLSIGMGGIAALTLLPAEFVRLGPGVWLGFCLAIWCIAWPAMLAEQMVLRIHAQPLVVALVEAARARHMRSLWLVSAALLVLVSLAMVCVALVLAAWSVVAGAMYAVHPGEISELLQSLRATPTRLGWVLPAMLLIPAIWWQLWPLTPRPKESPTWAVAFGPAIGTGVVLVGWPLLLQQWPQQAPLSWGAVIEGVGMGVPACLVAMGVYYTQVARRRAEDPERAAPAAAVALGLTLWTGALLGWGLWLAAPLDAPLSGVDSFLIGPLLAQWPRWLGVLLCLGLALALSWTARLLLDISLHWLQWRWPSRRRVGVLLQCGVLSLAMLLALALGADAADPRHDQAMEGIQSLRRWGVPLTALLIMSVLIRGLPPAPLLWVQQTHPAWAVARYLYWRYAVRLALLCILLRESGWGPILWRFWQTSTHE